MPVHSLGYLRFESPRVDAWRAFGADVLGFMGLEGEDGSLGFRIDAHPPRLVIEPAAEKRVQAIGFQVRDSRRR
jgi:3,4-dihydroxy-9,10-secoandrosta-1,3,5(10)-triene-9,17-dione 4,5-dioxygenase